MCDILFIAPHADDETLAAGGTIHKLSKQDPNSVVVLALTLSEQAHTGQYHLEEKLTEAHNACKELGVTEVVTSLKLGYNLCDMYVTENGATIRCVIEAIRRYNPKVVITTHYEDFHCDHRAASVACREAVYQAPRRGICGSFKEMGRKSVLLCGEVDLESIAPMKTHVVSVLSEEDIQAKVKALRCYTGFVGEHDSICSTDHGESWVRNLAHIRGLHFGVQFAEVFEIYSLHPKLHVEDLL